MAAVGRGDPVEALRGSEEVVVIGRDLSDVIVTMEPPFDLLVNVDGSNPATIFGFRFTPAGGAGFTLATPEKVGPGVFRYRGVTPGTYTFSSLNAPGMPFISSIQVGGQEALGRQVRLGPGALVHLVVGGTPATIQGTIDAAGGNRSQAAAVLLFPPFEADLEPVRYIMAAEDGSFSFPSLRPATYSVIAVADPSGGKMAGSLSDSALRALRARATSVKVEAGATEVKMLTPQTVQ